MPIHLEDLDVADEVAGSSPALIVPCYMCPAVTVAVKERRPFIQFFRKLLKSPPFERYIGELRSRLREEGVSTKVFTSTLPQHWFLCMWTSGRRNKLRKYARKYKAAIVLGCDTATATVRDSVRSSGCKVIEGMAVTGFVNARLRFHLPCNVSFEECKIIPMSHGARGVSLGARVPPIAVTGRGSASHGCDGQAATDDAR